jgi:hypothetical protein
MVVFGEVPKVVPLCVAPSMALMGIFFEEAIKPSEESLKVK